MTLHIPVKLLLFVLYTCAVLGGAFGIVELTGGGKDGAPGPPGPRGEQGPKGPSGEAAPLDTSEGIRLAAIEQRVGDLEGYDQYAVCFLEADRRDRDAYHDYLAGASTFGVYQSVHAAVVIDEQNCLDLYYPGGQ